MTALSELYEFIGFGAMDVTKPYEFIWFGDTHTPNDDLLLLRLFDIKNKWVTAVND